jgi:hypothetical protein
MRGAMFRSDEIDNNLNNWINKIQKTINEAKRENKH